MLKLVMIAKVLLYLIAMPLYVTWFYFIYYMIFKDFTIGLILFVANIVAGYIILFINNFLSSYRMRLMLYAGCETEEEKAEIRKMLKDGGL